MAQTGVERRPHRFADFQIGEIRLALRLPATRERGMNTAALVLAGWRALESRPTTHA
jgi:hypothetical protein